MDRSIVKQLEKEKNSNFNVENFVVMFIYWGTIIVDTLCDISLIQVPTWEFLNSEYNVNKTWRACIFELCCADPLYIGMSNIAGKKENNFYWYDLGV